MKTSPHTTTAEKILWRDHPSRWQFVGFYAKSIAIIAIIAVLSILLSSQGVISSGLVVLVLLVTISGAAGAAYIKRSLTTYTITTQRVRIESGFFIRRREECSLRRVQNTDVRISILQRLVKIGTVDIDTATDVLTHDFVMAGVKNPYAVASYISTNTLGDNEASDGL